MPAYTMDAFVLRRMHFGETENVLTLYSPDRGRFSAIGVKASGGIRTVEAALQMLDSGANRIGTSSGSALYDSYRPEE